jgi:uncharacterized protein YxjI
MNSYPLSLSFKIIAISPQVRVTDAMGRLIMYVRQKAFKLKEDVTIFADEQQQLPLLHIKADRIIDVSATYTIRDTTERVLGAVRGQGIRSLWRRSFAILDASGQTIGDIKEDNPWVKVADGLLNELPLGWIAGLFVNPSYTVTLRGVPVLQLRKKPSVFERHFELACIGALDDADEPLVLSSLMMMLLLVRGRG